MNIFPKNPHFFGMFESLAKTTQQAGKILFDMHAHPHKRDGLAKKLEDLEHEADAICHSLYKEAERTFITPIDREDISALAKHLDDVVDVIEDCAAKLFLLTGSQKTTKDFQSFTVLIVEATAQVAALTEQLKSRERHVGKMRSHIIQIHELENKGDDLFRASLTRLFAGTRSPITIIKWKDIYESLEAALDNCEHVADTVDFIIIKNF